MKKKSLVLATALLLCNSSTTLIASAANLLSSSKSVQSQNDTQAWKDYSSAEGEFSILFPGDPTQETQVIEAGPGLQFQLHIHKLNTIAECSVMYADYPVSISDPAVARKVLDDGAAGAVASVNSELLELREIELDGHAGRYLKERMPNGEIMRVKMLLVGQRLYQVAITTPREDNLSAEMVKSYEATADKFLKSFKLIKQVRKHI